MVKISQVCIIFILVPEYLRRPGSSYRKKYYGFRTSSWMRRRSVSSMKHWSGGCRNAYCYSPRWVSRWLEKPASLFLSSRCSPCYFFFVHLCNRYCQVSMGSLRSGCCKTCETLLEGCIRIQVWVHPKALLVFPPSGLMPCWWYATLSRAWHLHEGRELNHVVTRVFWATEGNL